MTKIKDIAEYLESVAPLPLQEGYDNAGLLCGDPEAPVQGILITLDTIEEVIDEAVQKNCNLIISHHPIIFKGLKSLTGKNYVERTVIKAIQNNIALYAIHTNLDHVHDGVNKKLCDILGIINTTPLLYKESTLKKLTTFIPNEYVEKVMKALHDAGAGNIGKYEQCSFRIPGQGTFMPLEEANPFIGTAGTLEYVSEERVEVIFPFYQEKQIVETLKKIHPYEEVAYYINKLDNLNQEIGAGMVGELVKEMDTMEFLNQVKTKLQVGVLKHTRILKKKVKKIAVCGGSGSFLLQNAIRSKADLYISSDFKYHEFFDAENKIIIADIGHYESEFYTKELIRDFLIKKFTTFALKLSETVTNPISYL